MVKSIVVHVAPNTGAIIFRPGLCIHVRIVVDERNIDASVSSTFLEGFHICNGGIIWCFGGDIRPLITVLIFNLIDEYTATSGDLMLCHNLRVPFEVRCPCISISGIIVSECSIGSSCQPARKAPGIGLGIDIWARTKEHI